MKEKMMLAQELATNIEDETLDIAARQLPLRTQYAKDPSQAMIIDRGETSAEAISADQALYGSLTIGEGHRTNLTIGVHEAVGGRSDAPNPGEILAGAIAACMDSATRMIANILGIQLTRLNVSVEGRVDVRGTLQIDASVPVGFQDFEVLIDIAAEEGVTPAQIDMLLNAAERSCILVQTLRHPPEIRLTRITS
jgi:uncharacterized OsmC-like protein